MRKLSYILTILSREISALQRTHQDPVCSSITENRSFTKSLYTCFEKQNFLSRFLFSRIESNH